MTAPLVAAAAREAENQMETRRIVIFGSGQIAELADFYFTNDSGYEVAAFTVDRDFLTQDEFRGRPVVPFERVAEEFPPQEFGFCRDRLHQTQPAPPGKGAPRRAPRVIGWCPI